MVTKMTKMSKQQIRNFLMQGTLTGKLATVKQDGSPHVVPIWFIVDYVVGNSYIVFTTNLASLKAKNILRDHRVSICVDDQTPPFSFVSVYGTAKIHSYTHNELLKWATKIAGRYIGKKNAKAYGKRNSDEGEVLVRVKPTKMIAEKNISGWN
jgi:PPOX class probable F420-dependent enzyme